MKRKNGVVAAVAVGIFALLTLAASLGRGKADPGSSQQPSTFHTDADGARALLLVMERVLPGIEQWRRPLSLLPFDPFLREDGPTTLIVAGPVLPLSVREARRLEQWIAAGGQLILATNDGWAIEQNAAWDHEESDGREEPPGEEAEPGNRLEPDANEDAETEGRGGPARGVDSPDETALKAPEESVNAGQAPLTTEGAPSRAGTLTGRHGLLVSSTGGRPELWRVRGPGMPEGEQTLWIRREASWFGRHQVVARAGEHVVAASLSFGAGRIVVIADPNAVSNEALRKGDNAVWLVSLVAGWRNGRALVDEFHHGFGQRRTLSSLTIDFLGSPWGWGVLQAAFAGLLYLFGYRRRLGRVVDPAGPAKREPLELVEARAGLFKAAAAGPLAVELVCQQLSHQLRGASGRPVDLHALLERLRERPASGDVARRLEVLVGLLDRARKGGPISDSELLEATRLAGELQRDLALERPSAPAAA